LRTDEQIFLWGQINEDRKEEILLEAPISVLQTLGRRDYKTEKARIKAFDLFEGRLREITISDNKDLTSTKPIWIDLVNPTFEDRIWVGDIFDIEFPDPNKLSDLESSARFYIEERGEIHLHSDFLLDKEAISRNVAVSFILHKASYRVLTPAWRRTSC